MGTRTPRICGPGGCQTEAARAQMEGETLFWSSDPSWADAQHSCSHEQSRGNKTSGPKATGLRVKCLRIVRLKAPSNQRAVVQAQRRQPLRGVLVHLLEAHRTIF